MWYSEDPGWSNERIMIVRERKAERGLRSERGLDQRGHRISERCVDYFSVALEVLDISSVLGGPQVVRRGGGDTDSRGGVQERSSHRRAGDVVTSLKTALIGILADVDVGARFARTLVSGISVIWDGARGESSSGGDGRELHRELHRLFLRGGWQFVWPCANTRSTTGATQTLLR